MIFLKRLEHGRDIVEELGRIARELDIKTGWFNAIGALKNVEYGFYDQQEKVYRKNSFEKPCEITSCIGNVSILEGEIFIHAHITFADEKGTVRGGHLFKGEIFACEVALLPSVDILERKYDEKTGLKLWM